MVPAVIAAAVVDAAVVTARTAVALGCASVFARFA